MLYGITYETITNWLLPPKKRKPKYKAFFKAMLSPLQWLQDLFADDYINGQEYQAYNGLAIYQPGDRITFSDNRNYEFIFDNSAMTSGLSPEFFPQYWLVIQDNFIGANDRVKFNGQIIMLEVQLNVWFRNTLAVAPTSQIYLVNNVSVANFWLGNSGPTSSKLANQSSNVSSYLANASAPAITDFTVYVPVSLSNTWTTETPDIAPNITSNRENKVRRFVDGYKLSGINYKVITY